MLPPFQAPAKRPELINASTTIRLEGGSPLNTFESLVALVHGANYNDPQRFVARNYHQLRRSS